MSIARGSLSGAPVASTRLRARRRVHAHDLVVARHVQRPVQLDGDIARVVERRARRDGRDRARPGIDAAERDPVRDEQLAGRVHGEAGGVLEIGDVGQGARGEVEPQHLVALPVGDVGLAVRRQRDAHGVLQALAADHRVDACRRERSRTPPPRPRRPPASAPSGATATAHGSLSGAPPASSEAAPPPGRRSTRPELPNQLPSSAIAMSPGAPCAVAGATPEARERDERRARGPRLTRAPPRSRSRPRTPRRPAGRSARPRSARSRRPPRARSGPAGRAAPGPSR